MNDKQKILKLEADLEILHRMVDAILRRLQINTDNIELTKGDK